MTVTQMIILLAIGFLMFTLDRMQKNLPVPVILVVIGSGLSFIPYFSSIQLTGDMIYSIFLPALLFISAYHFSARALKRHAGIIGFLSTFGILLTVILLGTCIYYLGFIFTGISFVGALLLASILTPTDPISVVAVLKKSSDNPDIANVVDGESMINDGTSIVLFTVLLSMYEQNQSLQLIDFMQSFLYVSVGGVITGIIVGWVLSKAGHLFNDQNYHVMLSIVMAYGGFHLAEHVGFSGVLATVAAGMMLAWEFAQVNNEDHYRERLDGFWNIVEPSLLSLLFLLIGIEATPYLAHSDWLYVILIFITSILIRYVIVAGTLNLFSTWDHMTWDQSIIIAWSGIKGTMSIFLILTLSIGETSSGTDFIASIGYSVVILSLIFQSIGVYPLSRWLNQHKASGNQP